MVTEGQLLERSVVVYTAAGCLDGIYLRGAAPGVVIASPLPFVGGSMTNPVANEVAYAAARAGRASLRLDYRGVGGSEGAPSTALDDAAQDLREGLEYLLETTRARSSAVVGVASGAWAALRAARLDPRIDRLLLVSPPRREPLPPGVPGYAELGIPVLVVLGEKDPQADAAAEEALVAGGGHGRLRVLPGAGATLREALTALARLVPPFLGAEVPEP